MQTQECRFIIRSVQTERDSCVEQEVFKIKQAAANVKLKNPTECYGTELNCAIYTMGFYVIERLYCLTILLLSVQNSRYVITF